MSKATASPVRVVMIGTAIDTQGGISAVVSVLKEAGLFEQSAIEYIATHRDGSAGVKMCIVLRAWFRLIWLLITGRIDLLHVHTASRASFWRKCLFMLPAFLARVPVVLHLHGGGFRVFYSDECPVWQQRFVRWVFERTRCVIVLSESWLQWAQATFPSATVAVIPNPVRLPSPPPMQNRAPCTLLFLGRLGVNKGVYELLQAVATLAQRHPRIRLLLGGDGDIGAVRARSEALGIAAHVQLLGWVSGNEKSHLLREAAIYVLPSFNEGLPMSILEAMAYGLPVVSTPVGGIPEAVRDGDEGFLVAPGDAAALADRLDQLLSDAELRKRMGAAARTRAESLFGAAEIVARWRSLYRNLGGAS